MAKPLQDTHRERQRHREGIGNPLQCSCLENPRDGGASWAAVYGVPQSQTRLKQLSSSSIEKQGNKKGGETVSLGSFLKDMCWTVSSWLCQQDSPHGSRILNFLLPGNVSIKFYLLLLPHNLNSSSQFIFSIPEIFAWKILSR